MPFFRKYALRNAPMPPISKIGSAFIMLLMKWTDIGKNYFAKLFVLDHGASTWIESNLSGSFCEVLFRPNLSLLSQVCHSSLSAISEIAHEIFLFFSQKFQTFQKTWNSFTCKWLSILPYWTLLIFGVATCNC